jgi:hypothetical protein
VTTNPCGCQTAAYIAIDEPAVYRICVAGRIPSYWRDHFEDMTIATTVTADGLAVTTLCGVLADQAALMGVINGLYDMRMAMLCVECLETLRTEDNSVAH